MLASMQEPTRPSASLPHPLFTLDLCRYQLAAATFYTATAAGELNHIRHSGFPAREIVSDELDDLGLTIEMSELRAGNQNLLLSDGDGALALLQTYGGEAKGSPLHATVMVAAQDPIAAEWLADSVRRAFGAPDPDPHLVPMTFWTRSSQGPRQMPKLIATPLWEEIEDNYAAAARVQLERLMGIEGLDGGRLIGRREVGDRSGAVAAAERQRRAAGAGPGPLHPDHHQRADREAPSGGAATRPLCGADRGARVRRRNRDPLAGEPRERGSCLGARHGRGALRQDGRRWRLAADCTTRSGAVGSPWVVVTGRRSRVARMRQARCHTVAGPAVDPGRMVFVRSRADRAAPHL